MPSSIRRFNSRTPGGVRQSLPSFVAPSKVFQFTHPGRGATLYTPFSTVPEKFQFTHPGRGATVSGLTTIKVYRVSIHAPREGCDGCVGKQETKGTMFQFTHPGRGATRSNQDLYKQYEVSIHAPREGCDSGWSRRSNDAYSFNSRTPGGVRLSTYQPVRLSTSFQFTHPGRGATRLRRYPFLAYSVSIHAPREGCDGKARASGNPRAKGFNSRTPGGVRLSSLKLSFGTMKFQFTHPGRGATRASRLLRRLRRCFNSRTPGGVRRQRWILT